MKTYWASTGVLVLTVIHHLYGAVIYEAAFRLHVALFVVPVLLVQIIALVIYRKHSSTRIGKSAWWLFMLLTLIVSVVMIGLFEGGYNHLLKNILYFGGASQSILDQLFPPSMYEMPDDFWFEASGVLQFFVGIYAARCLTKLWHAKIKENVQ